MVILVVRPVHPKGRLDLRDQIKQILELSNEVLCELESVAQEL